MSSDGLKTNTPELKQSGHPASGAAENSSRSNSSSQFRSTCVRGFKKMEIYIFVIYFPHQCIGVKEDGLLEPREPPAVQLGECDAQLRPLQQRQVGRVLAVDHAHVNNLVVNLAENLAGEEKQFE